jgi:hypothetical protein
MNSSPGKKSEKKGSVKKSKPSDGRLKLIMGILLLFLAFFAGLSLISYLFTWKADQVLLTSGLLDNLADAGVRVENWAGKAGVIISNLFIYKWFGLPSLILVFLLFVYGLALLGLNVQATTGNEIRTAHHDLVICNPRFLMPTEVFQYGGGHGIAISAGYPH